MTCSPTGMFALPNLMSHVSSLRDEIRDRDISLKSAMKVAYPELFST